MVNTSRLRAMIGWLGILLPWIVVLLIWKFPTSISATWYTNACTVFMIVLGSASILLMCYKGYDKIDDFIFTFAGIFGLGICLFPCWIPNGPEYTGTFLVPIDVSNIAHNMSAMCFFLLLSVSSLFLFTKSCGQMSKKKKARNVIYRICGICMLLAFAILLLPNFYIKVWLTEAIALFFFGISWLTKANIYKFLFAGD